MLRPDPHCSMLKRIPLGQGFRFLVEIVFNIELWGVGGSSIGCLNIYSLYSRLRAFLLAFVMPRRPRCLQTSTDRGPRILNQALLTQHCNICGSLTCGAKTGTHLSPPLIKSQRPSETVSDRHRDRWFFGTTRQNP
jgi:hypothetical protein